MQDLNDSIKSQVVFHLGNLMLSNIELAERCKLLEQQITKSANLSDTGGHANPHQPQ